MRRVALALVAAASACSTVLGLDPGEPRDGALLEAGADGTRSDAESGETAPGDDGAPTPDGQLPRDAGVEASADVAPPPPPPRKEPQIECGDASCVPAVTKCVLSCGSGVQLNCQPWQAPLGGCAIGLCDDTADCPSAVCCARPPGVAPDVISGASCRPDCGDAGDVRLCDPGKQDCPSGACKPYFGYFACQ